MHTLTTGEDLFVTAAFTSACQSPAADSAPVVPGRARRVEKKGYLAVALSGDLGGRRQARQNKRRVTPTVTSTSGLSRVRPAPTAPSSLIRSVTAQGLPARRARVCGVRWAPWRPSPQTISPTSDHSFVARYSTDPAASQKSRFRSRVTNV